MRYVVLLLIVGGMVILLKNQYPYLLNKDQDIARLTYMVALIALIAGGTWASGRYSFSMVIKYALTWLAIILGLVLLYTYRDALQWKRIKAELFPNQVEVNAEGALSVRASEDGHFHIEAQLNGVPVNFIVDTGASDIVLSAEDAQRIGFNPDRLEYTRTYSTANGTVRGAPVVINSFKIGYAVFRAVPASVNGGPMDGSLLGLSFLRQFRSYQVHGDVLTLYP